MHVLPAGLFHNNIFVNLSPARAAAYLSLQPEPGFGCTCQAATVLQLLVVFPLPPN